MGCETRTNGFLEGLGCSGVRADHVITMTNIPHYFGIRPVRVRLGETTQDAAADVGHQTEALLPRESMCPWADRQARARHPVGNGT